MEYVNIKADFKINLKFWLTDLQSIKIELIKNKYHFLNHLFFEASLCKTIYLILWLSLILGGYITIQY